ncbi:alpha/beta hydrolase [Photobacterium piscicola]|nr:alpha/beta hydrolase [Photobacterium piscicola]
MNMPFERGNKHSNKAILLVHGLGDSPHSFSDLASTFAAQGFYVQVLLLPGHGSSPKDILLTTYSD